jgi:hypothetical protein
VNDVAIRTGDALSATRPTVRWSPPDARRLLQLALATLWLLDGVLQLQPFFFTSGANGFGGMLAGTALGNPGAIARSIAWNASVVDHHTAVTDAAFASIQILLGFGIAWRVTVKPALAASVAWSLAVWWFGEGLGGIFRGAGTPLAGGPGAVLFYAVIAVLLWPADRAGAIAPFAAARSVGATAAKLIWAVVWLGMAVLALLGSGRSPQGVHDWIEGLNSGEPGWLSTIDRHAESLVAHRGLAVAVVVAAFCVVTAVGVFLPVAFARAAVVVAVVVAAIIWIVGQNLGMILAGGATDPNSGPLLVLLALAFWPAPRSGDADPSHLGPLAGVPTVEVA